MGAPERFLPGHRPGGKGAWRGPGQGDVIYILCLWIFLQFGRSDELWALVPQTPILLPVVVSSLTYSLLFSSNVSLGLSFMDLVTSTRLLEGTWPTKEILCSTTNVFSIDPFILLHNMTMGNCHGNLTYSTILDMKFHVPLIAYKFPQRIFQGYNVHPCLTDPGSLKCPRVPQMSTFLGLPIPVNTASLH